MTIHFILKSFFWQPNSFAYTKIRLLLLNFNVTFCYVLQIVCWITIQIKSVQKKLTTFVFGHFTTISGLFLTICGHFYGNYIDILNIQKEDSDSPYEVLSVPKS